MIFFYSFNEYLSLTHSKYSPNERVTPKARSAVVTPLSTKSFLAETLAGFFVADFLCGATCVTVANCGIVSFGLFTIPLRKYTLFNFPLKKWWTAFKIWSNLKLIFIDTLNIFSREIQANRWHSLLSFCLISKRCFLICRFEARRRPCECGLWWSHVRWC